MEEDTLKFVVDHMLGKLVKYLRMLGVDTVYFTQTDVSMLIEKAYQEKRIILSRNTKLKHIDGLTDFFFINDDQPDKQLSEVLRYFKIRITHDHLFTRCLTCNQKLVVGNHEDIKEKFLPIFAESTKNFLCALSVKKFIGRAPI